MLLDAEALEQGHLVGIRLNPPDVTRHQELHEGARGLVPLLTLDRYFVDVAVIDVADSAHDEVAVAIDQSGRRRMQRLVADLVTQAGKILDKALELSLGV